LAIAAKKVLTTSGEENMWLHLLRAAQLFCLPLTASHNYLELAFANLSNVLLRLMTIISFILSVKMLASSTLPRLRSLFRLIGIKAIS
jgi:hypothetical protein